MGTKLTAYRAREGVELSGGSIALADGETFDVGAALKEGKGTIVVEDGSPEHQALEGFDALVHTSVPAAAKRAAEKADAEKEAAEKAAAEGDEPDANAEGQE